MKRYITHVFNEGLPNSGFRKLAYITITDEDNPEIEYFLGTDNNPLYENKIQEMVKKGKILPLQGEYPELPEEKSLFVDSKGSLYLANRLDADLGKEKLKNVIKEFLKKSVKNTVHKSIPTKLPEVTRFYEYV